LIDHFNVIVHREPPVGVFWKTQSYLRLLFL
jgi:hypothetical protein